jgi:RNA polymerase sigma-32 factor
MRRSALSSYVDRVRRRGPRLSLSEEKRLARRMRTAGDRAAALALVTAHLDLVVRIARDFQHLHPNLLELIQEGNLALMRAVHRYDPDRPVRMSAYAASWVRTYIARFVLASLAAERGFVIEGGDGGDGGGDAAARELYGALRSWEAKLAENDNDAPAGVEAGEPADGELAMLALMTGDDATVRPPDQLIEEREEHERLAAALPEFEQQLTPREREIFRARLIAERPSTLSQKGSDLGLSAERIRQIERDLTERLRARLSSGDR